MDAPARASAFNPNPADPRQRSASLRGKLLWACIPLLLMVFALEALLTYRLALATANAAYDRSLLGALRAIDANVAHKGGGISMELPYRLLEFFQLTATGEVYYRVATEDGLVEIGDFNLPSPPRHWPSHTPLFENINYLGKPVRLASYVREIDWPANDARHGQRIIVQLAESMASRDLFSQALLQQTLGRDLLLMALTALLLVFGVFWALRPLLRLRKTILSRHADDMSPMDETEVLEEIKPLVQAMNQHISRQQQHLADRRSFVDGASHQLRTPLTTLATQMTYAIRATTLAEKQSSLIIMRGQVRQSIDTTNHILALARADAAQLARQQVDLVALGRQACRRYWSAAQAKQVTLHYLAPEQAVWVHVDAALMLEAINNLIDNALHYITTGGRIDVHVVDAPRPTLAVTDDGPGVNAEDLPRLGERFYRPTPPKRDRENPSAPGGTGLGLALVKTILTRHDGEMRCAQGLAGKGLEVTLILPRPVAKDDGARSTPAH